MTSTDSSVFILLQGLEIDKKANVTVENGGRQLISDEFMAGFHLYFDLICCGFIAMFGCSCNIINMTIFFKLGIKDSMSVGLMSLSFTDFVVTFLGFIGPLCVAWDALFPHTSFDPIAFQYVAFGWYRDTFYLISGWITTLLSVERCVCVVSPFRVKQIFTRTRAIIAVILLYVINFSIHMPVLLTQWLAYETIEVGVQNGTTIIRKKMVVGFSDNRDQIHIYIDIANGAVIPIPSQAIVLISVIWLIYGLHASSKVRKSASESEESGKSKKSNLSSRENKLVKVVLFLAIILTVCNIPRFLAVYAKRIFTAVRFGDQLGNLYSLIWNIVAVVGITNSSVNIFVYLIVNSNYRKEFRKLFGVVEKE